MSKFCSFIFIIGLAVFGPHANAQIIKQTPRPEIPQSIDDDIENIKPAKRTGRSGTIIQIPRPAALLFASFDQNYDNIIDAKEINHGIKRAFERADKNADGKLSLIELEAWRVGALGSEHAAPTNYTFAPNFARSVSRDQFSKVLSNIARRLDKDDKGNIDGIIKMSDLLKPFSPPRAKKNDNCMSAIMQERRRAKQQCRTRRGY